MRSSVSAVPSLSAVVYLLMQSFNINLSPPLSLMDTALTPLLLPLTWFLYNIDSQVRNCNTMTINLHFPYLEPLGDVVGVKMSVLGEPLHVVPGQRGAPPYLLLPELGLLLPHPPVVAKYLAPRENNSNPAQTEGFSRLKIISGSFLDIGLFIELQCL